MKPNCLNHTCAATQSKPLPVGEGLGWGLAVMSRTQRRTPTPLRLGDKSPSLAAPPRWEVVKEESLSNQVAPITSASLPVRNTERQTHEQL